MQSNEERMQVVVKSNDLIQRTRYGLSTQEQKIVLYLISKIKPTDDDFQKYELALYDLCDVCGIGHHGQNYQNFKDSIKALADKSFWIETPKRDLLMRWVEHVEIVKDESIVEIRLDPNMKPYLLMLRENFTQYELGYIMVLKSKYSIRLYEILKSYAYLAGVDYSLSSLKEALQIDGYDTFKDLKRRVIDRSVEEINEFTDLNVSYEPYRRGRSVAGIIFDISRKSSVEEVAVRIKREAELDGKKSCKELAKTID